MTNRERARRLLVGGVMGWQVGLLVVAIGSFVFRGLPGVISGLFGCALALLYFAIGQAVQVRFADADPITLRNASLASYGVRAAALAGLLWWFLANPSAMSQVDSLAFFGGVMIGTLAWLTGVILTFRRLRIPVFDTQETDC